MFNFLLEKRIQNMGYCADLLWIEFRGKTSYLLHVQTDWALTHNGIVLLNQDELNIAVKSDLQGNANPYEPFLEKIRKILSLGLYDRKINNIQIVSKNIFLFFEDGYVFNTVFSPMNDMSDELWRIIDEERQMHYIMNSTGNGVECDENTGDG